MHKYLNADAIHALNIGEHRTTRLGDEHAGRSRDNNNFRKPNRNKAMPLSDTIVTRRDGTQYIIPAFRNARKRTTAPVATEKPHRTMAADMAPIGDWA